MSRWGLPIFAVVAACYQPRREAPCSVSCEPAEPRCPDGLTCRNDGLCQLDSERCLVNYLTDDFDDGVMSPVWQLGQPPTAMTQETRGKLVITLSSTDFQVGGYQSRETFDARESAVFVEVVTVPNPQVDNTEMYLDLRASDSLRVGILFTRGTVVAFERLGGPTLLTSAPYDPQAHRYWRVREANGTTFWETSSNTASWDTLWSEPTPFDFSALHVHVEADTYCLDPPTCSPASSPGSAEFDNLNVVL